MKKLFAAGVSLTLLTLSGCAYHRTYYPEQDYYPNQGYYDGYGYGGYSAYPGAYDRPVYVAPPVIYNNRPANNDHRRQLRDNPPRPQHKPAITKPAFTRQDNNRPIKNIDKFNAWDRNKVNNGPKYRKRPLRD